MTAASALDCAASACALSAYRARRKRQFAALIGLAGLALAALVLDLVTGPSGLPLGEVLAALFGPSDAAQTTRLILFEVRLPVALMALLVGAALGLAGAEMQTVLENPLAEPFTLGVSSAAALGASVAISFGLGLPFLPPDWRIPANAFLFAISALALLQLMAVRAGGAGQMVLLGIALSFTAGAFLALVQFLSSADALQQLVFWTMGSLTGARLSGALMVALALAICLPFSLRAGWALTALRLGEEQARAYGVDVARLRRGALLRVSLLAAAAVSMVGVVGFVGLAAPHIARRLVGEDHRLLLPASLLSGAVMLSLASTLSKTLIAGVLLPVGMMTALIGLPVFFAVILRARGL